jgi:hypothetical protein
MRSRWQQGVEAPGQLKLADLQSHGALVLGDWVPFAPRDWMAQSCSVRIGHPKRSCQPDKSMPRLNGFTRAHALG